MLNIDEWPDGTDKILVYLLEQRQKPENDEGWGRRGRMARVTGLNKEQVRYRVEKLEDEGYLIKDYVEVVDQQFAVYRLTEESLKTAEAIQECTDVLGEIPEEPTRDDILHLTYEMASIRSGHDFTSDGDPVPEYIAELKQQIKDIEKTNQRLQKLEEKVQALDSEHDEFERKMDYIDQKTVKNQNDLSTRIKQIRVETGLD